MSTLLDDPRLLHLAGRVRHQAAHVLDVHELAALIESMGISDRIAQSDYGETDVLSLAKRIEPLVRRTDVQPVKDQSALDDLESGPGQKGWSGFVQRLPTTHAYQSGARFGRIHLQGFLFAMPMVVFIIGLLVLRESLWAALIYTPPIATAIGLGTIASFIVTGGYAQAIGRRGLFYRVQDEHGLSRSVCYYFVIVGLLVVAVSGIIGFALIGVFGILPWRLASTALAFYIFLSVLWLCLAVLYMQGQHFLFTAAIVIGIIIVHALGGFSLPLIARQTIALLLVCLLSFLGGYAAFGARTRRRIYLVWSSLIAMAAMCLAMAFISDGGFQRFVLLLCVVILLIYYLFLFLLAVREARIEAETKTVVLPRPSLLWYKVGPYFAYGAIYFTLLMIDRLIAWSAPDRAVFSGFLIMFRTQYEVGMDWGLIVLIITMGMAESAINSFSERVRDDEQRYSAAEADKLAAVFKRWYVLRAALFVVVAIVAAVVLYFGVTAIAKNSTDIAVRAYLEPIPRLVFWIATPGYAFLSWSLLNSVFLFALSRPEYVIGNALIALLLDAVVGYMLTRLFAYEWACVGFLIGSLALCVLSSWRTWQVMSSLDYYYYSAFL